MRNAKAEIYLHLVWATAHRAPLLAGDLRRALYRCIEAESRALGCTVLALGGMPDHVRLLVKVPTRVSAATLAHQAKGVYSRLANEQLDSSTLFRWLEGYAVFSVSPAHVKRVKAYIHCQEEHHASGKLWPEAEGTGGQHIAPP